MVTQTQQNGGGPKKVANVTKPYSTKWVGSEHETILSHVCDEGEHPIAFVSHTLTKSEQNYNQIEKEALGLVLASRSITSIYLGDPLHC